MQTSHRSLLRLPLQIKCALTAAAPRLQHVWQGFKVRNSLQVFTSASSCVNWWVSAQSAHISQHSFEAKDLQIHESILRPNNHSKDAQAQCAAVLSNAVCAANERRILDPSAHLRQEWMAQNLWLASWLRISEAAIVAEAWSKEFVAWLAHSWWEVYAWYEWRVWCRNG